jgi:hypothetical protein
MPGCLRPDDPLPPPCRGGTRRAGRSLQRLNQRYARAYNVRYGRRGHAFAERYLCVPVLSDEQLLTAYRYVVRNPVEAGLCARPGEWMWSSYASAIGRGDRFAFADVAFMVACCDGSLDTLRRFVESEAVPGTA